MRRGARAAPTAARGAVSDLQGCYFAGRKEAVLADLAANTGDRSIAGGVDPGVRRIVDAVNAAPALVTTSSCSGRVSLFHRAPRPPCHAASHGPPLGGPSLRRKRGAGLGFLFASHDPVADVDATAALLLQHCRVALALGGGGGGGPPAAVPGGVVELKFEPVILHALCRDPAAADGLLAAAGDAGLRRSGVLRSRRVKLGAAAGGGEARAITVEVGASFGFNTIVAAEGELLVTGTDALAIILRYANEQFAENERRKAILAEAIPHRCHPGP